MPENSATELKVILFGGCEVQINGAIENGFHNRSADKLLTLILFWDFIFAEPLFRKHGKDSDRIVSHKDLQVYFKSNFIYGFFEIIRINGL